MTKTERRKRRGKKEKKKKAEKERDISTVIVGTEAIVVCSTYNEQLQLPSCSKMVIERVAQ